MYFIFRVLSVITIIGMISVLPTTLLSILGWNPQMNWNKGAIPVLCTIVGHSIEQKLDRMGYIGFRGYLRVNYILNGTELNTEFLVIDQTRFRSSVEMELYSSYSINKNTICYYSSELMPQMKISLYDYSFYLIFFIICLVIGGIILIAWLSLEIYWMYLRRKAYKYRILEEELEAEGSEIEIVESEQPDLEMTEMSQLETDLEIINQV